MPVPPRVNGEPVVTFRPDESVSVSRVTTAVIALAIAVASGCALFYNWRREVSRQASFDHGCPLERVQVLRDNGDLMARAVDLDVCGQRRMYRDIGGSRIYLWQDVTDTVQPIPSTTTVSGGTAGGPAAPAASPTFGGAPPGTASAGGGPSAGPQPVSRDEGLAVLRSVYSEVQACASGWEAPPSVALRLQINGDGTAIYLGVDPPLSPEATRCLREVVATLRFRATGAAPIVVTSPPYSLVASE